MIGTSVSLQRTGGSVVLRVANFLMPAARSADAADTWIRTGHRSTYRQRDNRPDRIVRTADGDRTTTFRLKPTTARDRLFLRALATMPIGSIV